MPLELIKAPRYRSTKKKTIGKKVRRNFSLLFKRVGLSIVAYPRDAPATVLFGEWFRFGKPIPRMVLFRCRR
ncbi:hypothetical protein LXL04_021019 [Taraxacum kok-saghyz]